MVALHSSLTLKRHDRGGRAPQHAGDVGVEMGADWGEDDHYPAANGASKQSKGKKGKSGEGQVLQNVLFCHQPDDSLKGEAYRSYFSTFSIFLGGGEKNTFCNT